MRKVFLAVLAAGICLTSVGVAQQNPLTMQQALAIAQNKQNGLTLIYGRSEHGGSIWGFYFMTTSGQIIELELDRNGKILFTKTVPQIQNTHVAATGGGGGGGGPSGGGPSSGGTTKSGSESIPANKLDPNVLAALRSKTLTKLPTYRYLEIAGDKLGGDPSKFQVIPGDPLKVVVSDKGGGQVVMDMATGKILSSK